jgi:simple sugar transport system permease protein
VSATASPAAPLSPKEQAQRTRMMDLTTRWASQIGITVAFVLLWLAFLVMAPDTFGGDRIYKSFAQTVPYFGITAMMLTMVIVAGDIDLSFPSVMALGMVGFTWVYDATGVVLLGIITAIAVGAAAGLFNGLVVTLIGLPSLVVTIGTQFLFRGLTLVLVGGASFALASTRGDLAREMLVGKPLGIPMEFVWFLAITIGAWVLLNRHRIGGNTYVIGDNTQTARLMGIPIRQTRIILFVLTGMAAALAGMMQSLQVVNFYPNLGTGFLLPALAAVFVGGTSVFGGRGSIYGTFLGALMIGAIPAGIIAAGLTDFWTQAIYGAIILIAISIHAILQRRFQR